MKNIRIIHTNDIHSKFEPFEKMAFVISNLKTGSDILLDGGDFNDFSEIATKGTNGMVGLRLLNDLGYDASVIGNNEGFQQVKTIEDNCKAGLVNILSLNLVKQDGSKIDNLKGSIIKEIDGERFLIIGISPYKESYQIYYDFYGIKALNPYPLIKKEIKNNKGKYDHVILLSHIGLFMDVKIAQAIKDIDVIISSHTHEITPILKVNGIYIHESGVRGNCVGYLDLKIDNHKIIEVQGDNILINSDTPTLQSIKEKYEKYNQEAIDNLSKVITSINQDLTYKVDSESNLTNLLVDYMYNHYQGDFALINSGLTENNINKGNVTMLDVLKSCNSPIHVNIIDIKGKYIKEALGQSSNKEKCYENKRGPGFRGVFLGKLHVSYNCKIKRINNEITLFVNGKEIENEKVYKMISTDYFYNGRGYKSLGYNLGAINYKEVFCDILALALKDKESFKYINKERWES